MAIIEYDHSPNISPEQRLRSLADSVRRAFDELEQGNKTDITPIYINKLKKSVSIGEAASDDEHELFNVAWDARFKGDIEISVDSEFEELYTAVFGRGGVVKLLDMIFHIGYVIPTTNSRFDPNTLYPWQTWVRFAQGRTLVGVDESDTNFAAAENVYGEKVHKLETNEIPAHTHGSKALTGAIPNHVYYGAQTAATNGIVSASIYSKRQYALDGTSNNSWATISINATHEHASVGGNGAHNNVQPSIAVYYWKRTA